MRTSKKEMPAYANANAREQPSLPQCKPINPIQSSGPIRYCTVQHNAGSQKSIKEYRYSKEEGERQETKKKKEQKE